MNVTIFGSGYVGLVTGACLAEVGHNVVCMDVDQNKIDMLNNGKVPIYEPNLSDMIARNKEEGRIHFTSDANQAVNHGELQFIAVGTPPDEDGSADLKYVVAVADSIATHMQRPKIIITKSTVPVGTADLVQKTVNDRLSQLDKTLDFHVCSNPEFLKEGAAIDDFMKPDRIVVGTNSDYVADTMRQLYAPFGRRSEKVMIMDIRSAELTKYAANAMLATKISFMNEIASLAEKLGADVENVRKGIGSDSRIGYSFIFPGCGYGGSCFPKDVKALSSTGEQVGYHARIISAVDSVNEDQKHQLFQKLHQHFDGDLKGKTIALWGLAFKPNTDDMREAPSRVLMEALWQAGANVQAYDPEAMEECQRIYGLKDNLVLTGTATSALKGADALVVCTEWNVFRGADLDTIAETLNSPVVVDGRNLWLPNVMQNKGIRYYSIGRQAV